jgi:dTDP-glucose 4,6-dehydratase
MRIVVTGGGGFIGSALVLHLVQDLGHEVLTIDAMTYAANPASLAPLAADTRHHFIEADICDAPRLHSAIADFKPQAIMHLAAESHVDRSITGPGAFIRTNVVGTQVLLDVARAYWDRLAASARDAFRFLHVSTDEVFGSLGPEGFFTEETRYDPRSPYSASKAASDHLVRAWGETYGLPILVSNCSNNYGPRQFPEKLIPLMILNALEGRDLPVYGDGLNVRDWLHVDDHARALVTILLHGRPGQTYAVGGRAERTNREVVLQVCAAMDALSPKGRPHEHLIRFVADRPGHDRRYAIDCGKIEQELGWRQSRSFEDGLRETVAWYLREEMWWRPLRDRVYSGERLGLSSGAALQTREE